jgi:putative tryptophan/tyrosine transport system substrate-binding protein
MQRREFITLVGGTAVTWPLVAQAQQQRGHIRHIGILLFADQDRPVIAPLFLELEAMGYVDGKTVAVEYHNAAGDYVRLPMLAAELVRSHPDVIFSYSGELAPIVKNATASIPIVVVVSNDPVASGLVESLARPGGNLTGVTYVHGQLAGKAIELLHDALPSVSRVGILWNPNHNDPEFRETERAARILQIALQSLEVREPNDFKSAFDNAMRARIEAMIVIGSRLIALHHKEVGEFAAKNRIILAGTPNWLTEIGGVMTYGPNVAELPRRAASYVDKILRGARPADLPMQQPATFELAIDVKAAQALSLTIPPTLLARADQVIQ